MIALFSRFIFRPHSRGYLRLDRRYPGDSCHIGESRWHYSHEFAFGLWSINVHGFGLVLQIVGPFGR